MANETETTITSGGADGNDAKAEAAAAEQKLQADIAKLELALPKGYDAKDPSIGDFKKLAAQAGLDSKKSQGFFDFHHKTVGVALETAQKRFEQSVVDGLTEARKGWKAELTADKEFGGNNLKATELAAQKVFGKYAERIPELKDALEHSGWGDHPALVKLFALIGRDIKEDSVAVKGATSSAARTSGKGGPLALDGSLAYPNSPELHRRS